MIMEVVAVNGNSVEVAIISPPLQMGEIVHYDRDFVAQQICNYIHLL